MIKRTLVFSNPSNLSLRNCQLIIRPYDNSQEEIIVPVEDIGLVMIENPQVNMTTSLINYMVDSGVAVILCDSRHMPHAFIQNMDSNSLQGEMLHNQIEVGEVLRKQLWKQIIEQKIRNQAFLLERLHGDGACLKQYYLNVKSGDTDNREGIAAHIYWHKLFGEDFIRDRESEGINSLLNYGYAILRASTARALILSGLTPSLGLFHHNRSNAFPLADDIMEPFRPFVDEIVYHLCEEGKLELTKDTKRELLGILSCDTYYPTVTRPLQIGLSMTTASLAKCFSGEQKQLSLPKLYE